MDGIIIILGSPNNSKGELSSISHERIEQAKVEYRNNPGYKILPTGGFGKHFNTTDLPHAHYIKQYLISSSVPEDDILEFAISSNTIEDAMTSKTICDKCDVDNIIIVTSDFHTERARMIFEHVFADYDLAFSSSSTNLPMDQLIRLREHESRAMMQLRDRLASTAK